MVSLHRLGTENDAINFVVLPRRQISHGLDECLSLRGLCEFNTPSQLSSANFLRHYISQFVTRKKRKQIASAPRAQQPVPASASLVKRPSPALLPEPIFDAAVKKESRKLSTISEIQNCIRTLKQLAPQPKPEHSSLKEIHSLLVA